MIVAVNTAEVNYVHCAETLARSIRAVMPDESISIMTNDPCDYTLFDNVIRLPYGDLASDSKWKLVNDWQVYESSPYEYTIKIEADMYIPRRIDHWWDTLKHRDLHVCTTIRNIHNQISKVRDYRKLFDKNKLPDAYNAITYFRKSELAKNFFELVKDIFENWPKYRETLDYCPDDYPTTDLAYAIAIRLLGEENCTIQSLSEISFIHMKRGIIGTVMDYWPKEVVYEIHSDTIRFNTVAQLYPIHYHVKDFAYIIDKELDDE